MLSLIVHFHIDTQSYELEVYIRYAENYMMAKTRLEEMVDHPDVVEHFKTQPISCLKEAMKYILPKCLDEPCYHCFHYFDAIEVCSHIFFCVNTVRLSPAVHTCMHCICMHGYGFIFYPVSVSTVT